MILSSHRITLLRFLVVQSESIILFDLRLNQVITKNTDFLLEVSRKSGLLFQAFTTELLIWTNFKLESSYVKLTFSMRINSWNSFPWILGLFVNKNMIKIFPAKISGNKVDFLFYRRKQCKNPCNDTMEDQY